MLTRAKNRKILTTSLILCLKLEEVEGGRGQWSEIEMSKSTNFFSFQGNSLFICGGEKVYID